MPAPLNKQINLSWATYQTVTKNITLRWPMLDGIFVSMPKLRWQMYEEKKQYITSRFWVARERLIKISFKFKTNKLVLKNLGINFKVEKYIPTVPTVEKNLFINFKTNPYIRKIPRFSWFMFGHKDNMHKDSRTFIVFRQHVYRR